MKKEEKDMVKFVGFFALTGLAYGFSLNFLFNDIGFLISFFGYVLFMFLMGLGLCICEKVGTMDVFNKPALFIPHTTLTLLTTLILMVGVNSESYIAPFFKEEIAALDTRKKFQTFEEIQAKDEMEIGLKFQSMDYKQSLHTLKTISKNKQIPDLMDMELIRVMPLKAVETFVKQQEKAEKNLVFVSFIRKVRDDIRI